jgi:hypothetical protein
MNKTYIIHAMNFCFMVVMKKNGGRLKTKDCPALLSKDMQSVLGPALSPLQDEFISNCSHLTDSGVVS